MIKIKYRPILLICLFIQISVYAQQKQFCEQIRHINNLVAKHHIQPKPINDSLSYQVWDNFVLALDPNKIYFIKEDIQQFEKDKYLLDNYFLNDKCKFIKPYVSILSKRLDETESLLESFREQSISYLPTDSLYFDSSRSSGFSIDDNDKKEDWLRSIKYRTVLESMRRYEDKDSFLSNFEKNKPEVKNFVIDRAICAIKEIKQHQNGFEIYIQELFLNALASSYDPHTLFFNGSEKNVFDSTYQSNIESFGIGTDKDESGQIIITYVNPNSLAANEKKIEVGDIIRSLKFKKKTLSTACISNQEVVNFLNDETHSTIQFEIEKSRGQIQFISLSKAIIPVEYNSVDAMVIDDEVKAGYISVPSFYFNSVGGNFRGTSLDMGKVLYKLFLENVEGLIIDLRMNGGGSMKEAVDLANIFVDGPMAILQQKDNLITVYNNKITNLVNKPIVILVDANTASAAELFAGVLQDFNKAVIVGENTYGKATSQNIYQLDEGNPNLGFLKVTLEKFYRISGKSHQKTGIIPDISLPNILGGITQREKDYNNVLESKELKVKAEFQTKNLPISNLYKSSIKRQNNHKTFEFIKQTNENLKNYIFNKKVVYAFTPENVYDDMKAYENEWNHIAENLSNKQYLQFALTNYDNELKDPSKKERLNILKKYSEEDIIIHEAYQILKDFIKLEKQTNP